jgi:hypothetical protein
VFIQKKTNKQKQEKKPTNNNKKQQSKNDMTALVGSTEPQLDVIWINLLVRTPQLWF